MKLVFPNPETWAVMYLWIKSTDLSSLTDFDIWYCSDSVVFFYILEIWNISRNILEMDIVTYIYFEFLKINLTKYLKIRKISLWYKATLNKTY
jgi:hypothetical protein